MSKHRAVYILMVGVIAWMTVYVVENDWLAYGFFLGILAVLVIVVLAKPWIKLWRSLSDKTRKRTRRYLYGGVAVIAIVWGLGHGLTDVLATWLAGSETKDARLGFAPMLWWGRIGKGLQFIAGLAVLLDLIPAETLRKVGERAGKRLQDIDPRISERRSVYEFLAAENWLREHVITTPVVLGPRNEARRGSPMLAKIARVPPESPFSQQEYEAIRAQFIDIVIDHHQERRLASMARDLVERDLSPEQAFRLRKARQRRRVVNGVGMATLLILAFAWLALSVGDLLPKSDGFRLATGLSMMALMALMAIRPKQLYEAWLQLIYMPIRAVTEWQRDLLDRDPPAHPLRWLGFYLFVCGFVLDYLAS
ncbi:hypothetical protein [Nonomuraea typhae]|uniref:hypothetical protein n=1 Tax=Nonomuraea typhae TaxID=2603600 RepID=UPI0012FA3CE0|nr:hypothetical protein [Nonomuraea typhae]